MNIQKILQKSKNILGLNGRNFLYLKPYNLKKYRKIADNKLLTKQILQQNNIPIPKTYAIIENRQQLFNFDFDKLPKSFVIKPNMGLGGEGIIIVYSRKKNGNWVGINNSEISKQKILFHINDILEGYYSLTHVPDIAFFEQRIKIHKDLKIYSYKGIPDIRVIVFNKTPIMAMLRLPTYKSKGKSNLQLGGIGVGIDISTGKTTTAVIKNKIFGETNIKYLPYTKIPLKGIQIPYWDEILSIAIQASEAINLGYAGIDIAIDKEFGPVVLEVNARPGLSIQNANLATLRNRLEIIRNLEITDYKKGIKIAKELFGKEYQKNITESKNILNIIEGVEIIGKTKTVKLKAKIDTGAQSTSIDKSIIEKLGYKHITKIIEQFNLFKTIDSKQAKQKIKKIRKFLNKEKDITSVKLVRNSHGYSIRIFIELLFILKGKKIRTQVNIIDRSKMKYKMIIGQNDLKNFIIVPKNKLP